MIKNLEQIASTETRKKLLEILDHGLEQTRSSTILKNTIQRDGDILRIQGNDFNLSDYKKIMVLGIGKASGEGCAELERILRDKIDFGYCIDIQETLLSTIKITVGSHPHSSKGNFEFTENVVNLFRDLTKDDLVITIISGGGSALFCYPYESECITQVELFKELTKKGVDIKDLNTVRKHLSLVKGGGLAQIIYPATTISLIFSDVPGDDLTTIASGPTVKDPTTTEDAREVLKKCGINYEGDLFETPKEDKYFENINNFLVCSSKITLQKMKEKAEELNINSTIFKTDFQADADEAGNILLKEAKGGELLLASGETTVKIEGSGTGGRNQQLVLSSLSHIKDGDVIISCASDGHDYTEAAGAIGDSETIKKAQELKLEPKEFSKNNDSFNFFKQTKDHIITGPTGINVSDIFMVYKK